MEMESIKSHWEGSIPLGLPQISVDQQLETWLRSRSLHALKFFAFHPSTPSAEVSQQLERAFFDCAGLNFPLISTAGVRNASDIRLPDSSFSLFLKQLPMLPDNILANAPTTIAILQSRGLIKSIGFEDVLKELRSRPLTEDEMVACLKWWISVNKEASKFQLAPQTQFLGAAILSFGAPGSNDEKIIPLSSIRSFINTRTISAIIPLDGPLPDHLLPPSITKHFAANDLTTSFPWTELSIPDWVGHICSLPVRKANPDVDITLSALWAERVLLVVAKAWPNLPGPAKGEIYTHLRTLPCIPTSAGMKTPDQSYFAHANIFNDLPVVMLPSGASIKNPLERVLVALGVRKLSEGKNNKRRLTKKTRMIKTNEWTVADLAKYLVSIQSTLSPEEWARLKLTPAFFKEDLKGDTCQKVTRYQAQQLYEPVDVFRSLGLPVMDWGKQSKWRSSSDEALKYLLDHMENYYKDYDPSNFETVAFIPAVQESAPCMGTIRETMRQQVVSNPDWAMMGFLVTPVTLQLDAISKLKIKQHPPTARIVDLLERTPPKDQTEAKAWFSVLGSRVSDFSYPELQRMSQIKMVPVLSEDGKLRWLEPTRCYFGGDAQGKFHSKLFVFVSFGLLANSFLTACGTKHEPSVEEVVQILLEHPHKFYASAEGPTQFLAELRNIAVNHKLIKPGTIARMKKAAILLGSKRKPRKGGGEKVDFGDFDEDWEVQYDLRKAEEIIIADDTHALQAFGDSLFTAPQEDILEAFYTQLGSRRLSSLVKEEYQSSAEIKQSKIAAETRALILERLPLFLHEHSHARTRVSYTWLTSQVNFVVKTFGKLSVKKSLMFGDLRLSRQQEASAVATRAGNTGPIHLWIAGNAQIDMYEVAISLNRLIFDSPRANDALLFMTILLTDLKALKRRGYNGKILRQQRTERRVAEKAEMENPTLLSEPYMENSEYPASSSTPPTPFSPASAPPAPLVSTPPSGKPLSETSKTLSSATEPMPTPSRNPLGLFRRKTGLAPPELSPQIPPVSHKSPVTPNTDSHVTPLKNISSNIDMAIRACRPESGNLLRNRQEMRQVRESLDEGYCDIFGGIGDLNLIGEMGKVRVYLTQEVPDQKVFLINNQDLIARFIHVLVKLSGVYDLPLTSLHVFYDIGGGLIGFNRSGSIFVNLRQPTPLTSTLHSLINPKNPIITSYALDLKRIISESYLHLERIINYLEKLHSVTLSPSGGASFIIGPFSMSAMEQKSASSSSTPHPVALKVSTNSIQIATSTPPTKRRRYPMAPPLPLYHPLGRLALSLPPLDPASVGLPTPAKSDDLIRSPARARRPAGKSREITVEEETVLPPTISTIFDVEVRGKPSPRKRRAGVGSKRKRREADDGDATYPAKRSRMPRGSNQIIADEVAFESSIPEVTPTPEPMSEVPEDRLPERRSTRTRSSAKRRDSSASEAPSLNSTGAIRPSQEREEPKEEPISMELDQVPDAVVVVSKHPGDVMIDEKEEGELSDDGLPVNSS
ncbi:hypothetical protein C0995_015992 [Termitomyces sp. Mi166|nr:hypothetical protein C0995_015992 [Termitomyces sp. Mi166\